MLTKIDLCSMALLKIGEDTIQSWLDETASAKLCRTLYDTITDSLLASHPWRFAYAQYNIAKNADGDFMLPADCLRVLHCDGRVAGNRIISDSPDTVSVVAIKRVSSECFPSYFVSLLTTKLAMEFCIPLTGDQTIFRMLVALYESETQNAKFIDSTTSVSQDIQNFSLINTRF